MHLKMEGEMVLSHIVGLWEFKLVVARRSERQAETAKQQGIVQSDHIFTLLVAFRGVDSVGDFHGFKQATIEAMLDRFRAIDGERYKEGEGRCSSERGNGHDSVSRKVDCVVREGEDGDCF